MLEKTTLPRALFILSAPRSGSSLLGAILDGHPLISCPMEAGLAIAAGSIDAARETLSEDLRAMSDGARLERCLDSAFNSGEVVRGLVADYLDKAGKSILCEKALQNVEMSEKLISVFPDARFVLLYRHCMDVIASLIEASPWGFRGYGGVGAFALKYPENVLVGLAEFWLAKVEQMRMFQQRHPESCVMVRYEDLVRDQLSTVGKVVKLLFGDSESSNWRPQVTLPSAERLKDTVPGDYKIRFTRSLGEGSIGHGTRIPVDQFPGALLEAVNVEMKRAGYDAIDQRWNREPSSLRLTNVNPGSIAAVQVLEERFKTLASQADPSKTELLELCVEDTQDRLCIDPAANDGSGAVSRNSGSGGAVAFIGKLGAWMELAFGLENIGVALRTGAIRFTHAAGLNQDEKLNELSELLQCESALS